MKGGDYFKVEINKDLTIVSKEGHDQLLTFKPHVFNIPIENAKIIEHKGKLYVYDKTDPDKPIIQEWRNIENFQYTGGFEHTRKALGKETFELATITLKAGETPTPFNIRFISFLKFKKILITEEPTIAKRIIEKLEKKASTDLPHKDVHTLCELMNLTYNDFMEYIETYKS